MEALARKMAERLMADRVREMEEVAQERSEAAYRSGLEDGRSLGVQTTREEMAPVLEVLRGMTQEIDVQRDALLEGTERTLLQLSMTVTRRILQAELTVRPEAVLDILRMCLSQIKESSKVVVRVHPEDERVLRAEEGELRAAMGQFGAWELREDAQVPRGGCLIDTDFGVLDGRLESQLEEIERTLVREHEHGRQGTESISAGD
jgi:flagellar assembly protein FliH